MSVSDTERDELVEILSRTFPKMDLTDQLTDQYGKVLQRSVNAGVALDAIELYIQELDSPFPTPGGLRQRVERVNRTYTMNTARRPDDPLSIRGTTDSKRRHEIHVAKSKLIAQGAPPSDDPAWDDDTPPLRDYMTFSEYIEHLKEVNDTDELERVARVAPTLRANGFDVPVSDEERAKRRAQVHGGRAKDWR
jgi:hypothetical protein